MRILCPINNTWEQVGENIKCVLKATMSTDDVLPIMYITHYAKNNIV